MSKKIPVSRLIYLIMAMCLLVSILLAACSGSASPTSQAPPSTTAPVTSTQPAQPATTTQTTPAVAAPKTGGILKIGTGLDAVNLGNPPGQTTVQDTLTSKTLRRKPGTL
jgi:hypothetical protein